MPLNAQRSFAGGEIAPALYGRADQVKYATGLRTCRNFVVQRHGGVSNRPGTEFIAEVKDSSKPVRLIKFVFNADQTYVLEFGDHYMRVIRDGVQLTSGGSPYEIATPYAAADLADLQYVQSNDVVTIVHPSYAAQELKRTGDTAWTIGAIDFAPAISSPINITASGGGSGTTQYQYIVTAVQAETFIESNYSAVKSYNCAGPSSSTPVTLGWDTVTGVTEYRIYRSIYGVFGYIGTAGTTSFADTGKTPDTTQTAPISRNPFSTASQNFPAVAGYYQQRSLFANSGSDPQKVWMSRTGDFHNFSIRSPLQDDDAVTFTVSGREVNEVRHLVDIGKLVILTSGGEWVAEGSGDGTITPSAINLRQQGYIGASSLAPVVIGNSIIYVQARGNMMRDLAYSLRSDGYVGNDLTIFASHLFIGYTLVDCDYQQIHNSIVWVVRSDGTLLGLTYIQSEEIWGWHRHDTAGGSFEGVVCVPEGDEDAVYVVVNRTIGGVTKRYIERMHSRVVTDVTVDAVFVDSSLTYDGRNTTATTMTLSGGVNWTYDEDLTLTSSAAYFSAGNVGDEIVLDSGTDSLRCTITAYTSSTQVTVRANKDVAAYFQVAAISDWSRAVATVAGLDHLEGQTVIALGDGNVDDGHVVSGGEITLSRPYSVIHVGMPITADLETLDIEYPQGRILMGKKINISEVTVLVEDSRGIMVGPDADHLVAYKQDSSGVSGQAMPLYTGPIRVRCTSRWGLGGRVFMRQSNPLPLSVLAIAPSGATSD